MVVASPFLSALIVLLPAAAQAVALPAQRVALDKRDTVNGYPVLKDLRKRAIACSADSDCTGQVVPPNAYPVCASSVCSYRCSDGYNFNFWPEPSCVSAETNHQRILAAIARASTTTTTTTTTATTATTTAAQTTTAAAANAKEAAATASAAATTSAAAEKAASAQSTTTPTQATATAAASSTTETSTKTATTAASSVATTAAASSGKAANSSSAAAASSSEATNGSSAAATSATTEAAAGAPSVVTQIITVFATPSAASAAAEPVKTVTVTVTTNSGSGSGSSNDPYGVYSSGGNVASNVGSDQILNYTIPLDLPANTTIIPGNILENNITGFGAQNLTNNTGAIASWFRTNNSADSTNGHSWCYNPYNDSMPGFAPSFKTMLSNYGGDPIKAGQAYCGLEAIFYTPDGRNTTLYVIDAFDDKWVRTPSSVDVVIGAFPELFGSAPTSKNDVVQNVKWHFTGNRSTDYIFNNGRNAGSSSSSSSSSSSTVTPAKTVTGSNSTGSYSGEATWFTQNNTAGNCGTVHSDSTPLVALTTAMYAGGAHCGQSLRICATDNGKCVDATVQDSCPTCLASQDLDLSVAAFEALGYPLSAGVIPMTWSFTS